MHMQTMITLTTKNNSPISYVYRTTTKFSSTTLSACFVADGAVEAGGFSYF